MTLKEYNTCVDLYADGIFRFALKTMCDSDKAKDVVQDTFERLWVKHNNIEYSKAKSYLFTTAYHACIDIIRYEKRIGRIEERLEMPIDNQYTDLQEVLHAALNTLPKIQRSVILLRDYEGYSYSEIMEITDLSESQVKVYIYRARLALKQYIGKIETLI